MAVMVNSRLDIQKILGTSECVAGSVSAERIFGLARRTVELPAGWVALWIGAQGDHRVATAGMQIPAETTNDLFVVTTEPMSISFHESNLLSRDGFDFVVRIEFRVMVPAEAAELRSFRASINGQTAIITRNQVAQFLQPHVRDVIRKFVRGQAASGLIEEVSPDDISQTMADGLTPVLFSAGLASCGPVIATFSSTAFGQAQTRESQHQAACRQAELQAERNAIRTHIRDQRINHLVAGIGRLRASLNPASGLDMAAVLRALGDPERADLYLGLAAAAQEDSRTMWVVVAAGSEVLLYDPASSHEPERKFRLPTDEVGSARSVRAVADHQDRRVLLVGASRGVCVFDLESGALSAYDHFAYPHPLRGGFNRTAHHARGVILSHSELGLIEFGLGVRNGGRRLLPRTCEGATAVRHAMVDAGHLYFSRDREVCRAPLDRLEDSEVERYLACPASVTSMHIDGDEILAGDAAGNIIQFSKPNLSGCEVVVSGAGRPVESISVLQSLGIRRLYFSDTTSSAHARILGDAYACRYQAGGQTIRWIAAQPDLLAGVNDPRDRLFIWDHTDPDQPRRVISVARACGHTIQDLCLIAEPGPQVSQPVS